MAYTLIKINNPFYTHIMCHEKMYYLLYIFSVKDVKLSSFIWKPVSTME